MAALQAVSRPMHFVAPQCAGNVEQQTRTFGLVKSSVLGARVPIHVQRRSGWKKGFQGVRAAKPADNVPSPEDLVKGDVAQWEERQDKHIGAENVGADSLIGKTPTGPVGQESFSQGLADGVGKTATSAWGAAQTLNPAAIGKTPERPLGQVPNSTVGRGASYASTPLGSNVNAADLIGKTPETTYAGAGSPGSRNSSAIGGTPTTPLKTSDNVLKKQTDEARFAVKDTSSRAQDSAKDAGSRVQGAAKDAASKAQGAAERVVGHKESEKIRDISEELRQRAARAVQGLDDGATSIGGQAGDAAKRNTGLDLGNAHSSEAMKKGAVIHDFCFGLPYGAFLLVGSLVWGVAKQRAGATLGVALGIAQLACSWLSLRTWKQGYSPIGYTIPQAAIAGYLAWREGTQFFQASAPFFPAGLLFYVSAAMAVFFLYVQLSGGNPKKTSASSA